MGTDSPDLANTIAIVAVAFITAVVGPAVLLLLGRSKSKQDEKEADGGNRPLEGEAIALVLRMETRVQQAETGRERAEAALRHWREHAKRLAAHIIRLGETPEAPPEEEE